MKKMLGIAMTAIMACVIASCTVVVKERPGRTVVVKKYGNVEVIKVWRSHEMTGEAVVTINPGEKVRILKVRPKAVLIELPNGNTGWIARGHFDADIEAEIK